MANPHIEHLLEQAEQFWALGEEVPLNLYCEMLNAGLDVSALEAERT